MPGPYTAPDDYSVPIDVTATDAVAAGFTTQDELHSAIIYVYNNAPGKNARFISQFANSGNTKNAWLERFHQVSSDDTPFILAEAAMVVAVALSVKLTSVGTVELYKNAVLLDSWTLATDTKLFVTSLSYSLVAGDELSAKINNDDATTDPVFQVFIQVDGA